MVIYLTVYVDGLLFLNFYFDFLLLLTTSVILKRNVTCFRIMLGAFFGSLSIIILFFKIGCFEMFLIKLYLGFLMCIICFGYKNIKYFLISMGTFYMVSIVLGGFLYFLNLEFSYGHSGFVFFNKGFGVCSLFLCFFSPIILYFYIRQVKRYRRVISHFYKVDIYLLNMVLKLNGYLDTGNTLTFNNKMVVITNIDNNFDLKKYFVPCISVGGVSYLECILVEKVVVGENVFKDVYLAFNKNMNIYGMDVLLNGKMEG